MPLNPDALIDALKKNDVNMIKEAVSSGISVHKPFVEGKSPPLSIAVSWKSMDVLKYLVSQNVDLEARDIWGSPPLVVAAENGSLATVRFLLESEASVNAHTTDVCEYTALHTAVRDGGKDRLEIVKLLIKHRRM